MWRTFKWLLRKIWDLFAYLFKLIKELIFWICGRIRAFFLWIWDCILWVWDAITRARNAVGNWIWRRAVAQGVAYVGAWIGQNWINFLLGAMILFTLFPVTWFFITGRHNFITNFIKWLFRRRITIVQGINWGLLRRLWRPRVFIYPIARPPRNWIALIRGWFWTVFRRWWF
jgi:hypothetical protein